MGRKASCAIAGPVAARRRARCLGVGGSRPDGAVYAGRRGGAPRLSEEPIQAGRGLRRSAVPTASCCGPGLRSSSRTACAGAFRAAPIGSAGRCGTWTLPGRPVVRHGTAIAARRNAYAVHVEVTGLRPGRAYGYRFTLGGVELRRRHATAPAPGDMPENLRFAFCSCAEYENALPLRLQVHGRPERRNSSFTSATTSTSRPTTNTTGATPAIQEEDAAAPAVGDL